MISKAMLMAAGLGTRLRPFTDFSTKALLPVLGVPVAQYTLDSLIASGVETVAINIHHDPVRSRAGILELDIQKTKLVISDESQQLLGSAGGIRQATSQFGEEPFFLANADVLCDVDWRALEARHKKLRSSYGVSITLAIFSSVSEQGSYREIFFDSTTGLITRLGDLTSGRPFYVGAAVLEPEVLEGLEVNTPAEFIPTILEPAIRKKKAGVFHSSGTWFDIGSPRLWLNTHLSLIRDLEIGNFRTLAARGWKKRIEMANARIAQMVWVKKNSLRNRYEVNWAGPSYWAQESSGADASLDCPFALGPQAVLYGKNNNRAEFRNGIGLGGEWVSILP